jgi:hypothetical protein
MIGGVDNWEEGQQVCGVTIVNKVKLLGIVIDRKLEGLDENWNDVISRMRRLSGYWCNFGLSITGRVMVAKTYLVSQAIYMMGVLSMSQAIGDMMNEILVNFVSGRSRPIERQRQLLEVECGGYGMMDMNIMNMCIKSTWIRRAKDMEEHAPDYIGVMIIEEVGIEYDQIGRRNESSEIGIVGSEIMRQWVKLKGLYYDIGNNVLEAKLFMNVGICEPGVTVESRVLSAERYETIRNSIHGIIFKDIVDRQNRVHGKMEIEVVLGIGITLDLEP